MMMKAAPPPRIVEIRSAGPAEAGIIAELSRDGSTEPWSSAAVMQFLGLPGSWALLALASGDVPTGFLIARVAADEAELLNLVVVESTRRRGIGRALVRAALERAGQAGASAMFLEVAADNAAGCALYQSLGFAPVGMRPDYYAGSPGNYADALIMKRATVNSGVD
ncbi:MAG: GNAT family N-acetyltransferase [Rhodospirillales bacterium]|nr:MAG: GNAT family N-acetyltransferase [Rhodospirillales bacterium]